jgi:glutaredoxin
MNNKVLILRTTRCRKSDVMIRFLEENKIPFEVRFVDTDESAAKLAEEYNFKASPVIIVNGKTFNPYEIIKNCKVQNPEELRDEINRELLNYSKI